MPRDKISDSLTHAFRSPYFKRSKELRWYCGDLEYGGFPNVPACYVFIVGGQVVYVGSTANLNTRMRQHKNKTRGRDLPWPHSDVYVKYRPSKKWGDWAMLELRLIRRLQPVGNCCGSTKPREGGARAR
jgi:hypothetical protein